MKNSLSALAVAVMVSVSAHAQSAPFLEMWAARDNPNPGVITTLQKAWCG